MIVHLGWWLAPLFVTIVAFGWAHWVTPPSTGGYPDIAGALLVGVALIVSLTAWLIWALIA